MAFVTALNCIDGRVQEPVIDYLREQYNVEYVDDVTYPGMDKVLSRAEQVVETLQEETTLSVEKHGSQAIAVVGHFDCAANPGSRAHHITQIQEAIEIVKEWELGVPVVGLFVNEDFEIEKIA